MQCAELLIEGSKGTPSYPQLGDLDLDTEREIEHLIHYRFEASNHIAVAHANDSPDTRLSISELDTLAFDQGYSIIELPSEGSTYALHFFVSAEPKVIPIKMP